MSRLPSNNLLAAMPERDALSEEAEQEVDPGTGINTLMTDMAEAVNVLSASRVLTRRTVGAFGILDVAGMNYSEARYAVDKGLFPKEVHGQPVDLERHVGELDLAGLPGRADHRGGLQRGGRSRASGQRPGHRPPDGNAADTYAAALSAYTLAVNAHTKNPATAKAFMAYLAEPANTNFLAAAFNALPAIPNSQYTPPDFLKPFAALIQSGRFGQHPTWPNAKVQSDLNQGIQSVFIGHSTPDSVLKQMQQDLNP